MKPSEVLAVPHEMVSKAVRLLDEYKYPLTQQQRANVLGGIHAVAPIVYGKDIWRSHRDEILALLGLKKAPPLLGCQIRSAPGDEELDYVSYLVTAAILLEAVPTLELVCWDPRVLASLSIVFHRHMKRISGRTSNDKPTLLLLYSFQPDRADDILPVLAKDNVRALVSYASDMPGFVEE